MLSLKSNYFLLSVTSENSRFAENSLKCWHTFTLAFHSLTNMACHICGSDDLKYRFNDPELGIDPICRVCGNEMRSRADGEHCIFCLNEAKTVLELRGGPPSEHEQWPVLCRNHLSLDPADLS